MRDGRAPATSVRIASDRGAALILALVAMVLLTALGVALTLITSTETRVAALFRDGTAAFHVADASLERVVAELAGVADWNRVLDGSTVSSLVDGPPGSRVLPDNSPIDLRLATAQVNCGKDACSGADLTAPTVDRPWGVNNPRWQLYAYGSLSEAVVTSPSSPASYAIAWVADDASETDGLPLVDGDESLGPNPGRGLLSVLVYGYGAGGTRRVVEATLARDGADVRVLSWRERRQ